MTMRYCRGCNELIWQGKGQPPLCPTCAEKAARKAEPEPALETGISRATEEADRG